MTNKEFYIRQIEQLTQYCYYDEEEENERLARLYHAKYVLNLIMEDRLPPLFVFMAGISFGSLLVIFLLYTL